MRRPCSHYAPESCHRCDGSEAEADLYWGASPEERREFDRAMGAWWLRTHANLPT